MITNVPLTPREIEEENLRIYGQIIEDPEVLYDEELEVLDRLAEKVPCSVSWLPVLGGFRH
jgi:hypothetical protein